MVEGGRAFDGKWKSNNKKAFIASFLLKFLHEWVNLLVLLDLGSKYDCCFPTVPSNWDRIGSILKDFLLLILEETR